jgi:hypothetical protein
VCVDGEGVGFVGGCAAGWSGSGFGDFESVSGVADEGGGADDGSPEGGVVDGAPDAGCSMTTPGTTLTLTERVYVGGSTSDTERVREVQAVCQRIGWEITFDWTGPEGEIRTDGSWDKHREKGAAIARHEINACRTADRMILLSPPAGRGLGCWIEMGATLASGGSVWVVEAHRDSVFWQHPNGRRFATLKALMIELEYLGA